jgi:hypothetical protein
MKFIGLINTEQIFEEWVDSLPYSGIELRDYLDTIQSYIDFVGYYNNKIQGDNK